MKKQKGFYTISVVAELFDITPQTLRIYDEKCLVKPSRSQGNKRLYDDNDLDKLELVLRLTRDLGVNLAGVEIVLNMREKMITMENHYKEIVEVIISDFQEMLERMNDNEEEGLILCSQRKLMQIKQRFAKTNTNLKNSRGVKTLDYY
ncbi:MAG: hypothetical protein A2161_11080 [Candidatus Schekmanbacteria bacterium RBG_13_48_7]|uniref:HTH merR-type domain-containing protein n=1 Tax=Candidatus Schekmanbacteria bacterium RBG_13_48_7 TaxID=1817878 RepID=A0A1F7RU40_9BACT|nr:MAG: hypothetical protein A2161_11080 [Candidatus Schekmanbacteria bacterium RBG_13_48_7]